jgi:hypothetical protein
MTDLFEIIESVQVTLASSHVPEKDQLLSVHKALDLKIRNANKRLRECDALLASGHRSEAIQMAEHEPALLDVVSILDFAELPEWNDYVAELGLTVTPELLVDIAADLNLAYAEDAPLERHLQQLRLYSLARVPLRIRIDLLKKIARIDVTNPVWETDRHTYEEERLRQIKEEYRDAKQNNDVEKLNELVAELRGKWLEQPRKQFTNTIIRAVKDLESVHAIKQLRNVVEELQAAREQSDLDWAIQLNEKWNSLAQSCTRDSKEFRELSATAREMLSWAKQQQSMRSDEETSSKKVELLQRALNAGMDVEELRRRYVAATRYRNVELPAEIQQDYDDAILFFEQRRRTRRIIVAVCVVTGVVLIAIVIGVVKWMSSPENGQTQTSEFVPVTYAHIGDTGGVREISKLVTIQPNGATRRRNGIKTLKSWHRRLAGA